jgi:ABC-type nickel/cobalt efflux system permease component RcnA
MVHALMPGHGKTVLFSYFLGSGARLLTGVGMALKIALLHVGTAVVLLLVIGGAVVRLGRMQGAGRALEVASYIAVALIGAWLFYRAATRSGGGRDDGHRHGRGGILAYAVGLLPCPLTIILMNYALVNETVVGGLLLVGVMAAGIAVTMSLTGMTAILARRVVSAGLAPALFELGTRVLELAAAAVIFAIGIGSLARSL